MKQLITLFTVLLTVTLVFGCQSKTQTALLSEKEQVLKCLPYVFLDKNGCELRLNKSAAAQLGISPEVYEQFKESLAKGNDFWRNQEDELQGEEKHVYMYCPKDQVDTTGMPANYHIIDPTTHEILSTNGSR